MALTGTLADIGIVDLLQFPHLSQRTGELVVSGPEREARFFYADGKLIHAQSGAAAGMEALVDVVGWSNAEFHFHIDRTTTESTLDLDLHRALMLALKTRDERQREEQDRAAVGSDDAKPGAAFAAALTAFVAQSQPKGLASVVTRGGEVIAEACGTLEPPPEAEGARTALLALLAAFPSTTLKRVVIETTERTACMVPLAGGAVLVVLADCATPLGAVALSVSKLAQSVDAQANASREGTR
jgi:predicted regulator of Ras-like GTPase activity (Roadblock/LC7/MglB family)